MESSYSQMLGRRAGRASMVGLLGAAGLVFGITLRERLPARTVLPPAPLRVCADPDNLPFSNSRLEGFENRLVDLIAIELGRPVSYTWIRRRPEFARHTLRVDRCDMILGVPVTSQLTLPTVPVYRTGYVMVYRADRGQDFQSLDDPRLSRLRVGVHVGAEDYAGSPARALFSRRIRNVSFFTVYRDDPVPDNPDPLIRAVAAGDVDVAIAWGPVAGYFSPAESVPLKIVPITRASDLTLLPMQEVSLGVRHGDDSLKAQLDMVLQRREPEILSLLQYYHVPSSAVVTSTLARK